MTREQLEKDFDEKFVSIYKLLYKHSDTYDLNDIKNHIFEQMIPKVLEEILLQKIEGGWFEYQFNETLKQNAKEKFNINI